MLEGSNQMWADCSICLVHVTWSSHENARWTSLHIFLKLCMHKDTADLNWSAAINITNTSRREDFRETQLFTDHQFIWFESDLISYLNNCPLNRVVMQQGWKGSRPHLQWTFISLHVVFGELGGSWYCGWWGPLQPTDGCDLPREYFPSAICFGMLLPYIYPQWQSSSDLEDR